jgi:hypothetical protein
MNGNDDDDDGDDDTTLFERKNISWETRHNWEKVVVLSQNSPQNHCGSL